MNKKNYPFFRSSYKIAALLFLMYGSYSDAQYKIDPKFEKLIQQKRGLNKVARSAKNLTSSNKLASSEVVLPDGSIKELYHAIIYTKHPEMLKNSGILVQSVSKDFVTALVSPEEIDRFRTNTTVSAVMAPTFDKINNQTNAMENGAALLHNGALNTKYTGKGVLVGIYDTGIDFTHPDFRDPTDATKTRILSIWDQTLTATGSETPPEGFSYGVEYTQEHINDEIDGQPANFVREKDISGHGTHVAATAAGNGAALASRAEMGMAPEADIIIVKGGNGGFPTTNTIASLEYFKKMAEKYNKPIVVNMSIGGHGTPHDGTSPSETKVNEFSTSAPGRVVVIAAGNEGADQMHQRIVLAPNEKKSFTITTGSLNNETYEDYVFTFLAFTKDPKDTSALTAYLTAPDGVVYTQSAGSDSTQYLTDPNDPETNLIQMDLLNYVESSYGKRFIELDVTRLDIIDPAGTYHLEIENNSNKSVTLDGWLLTNDSLATTLFPEGDNYYTVGSPGTADEAITAANYIGKNTFTVNNADDATMNGLYSAPYTIGTINPSSSKGPRTDEAKKPDIAAGGTFVISAKSKDVDDDYRIGEYYSQMTGTSMASPTVAGATALLLQANKNLTAQKAKARIIATSAHDPYTTASYTNEFGNGKLNIFNAVAAEINELNGNNTCPVSENRTLAYDNLYYKLDNTLSLLSYSKYHIAIKYSPTVSGKLGSAAVYLGNHNNQTGDNISLSVQIQKVDTSGNPGEIIGAKTIPNIKLLEQGGWNTIDLSDLDIATTQNEDFFITLYTTNGDMIVFTDKKNSNGRFYLSTNNGATFNPNASYTPKVRAIIYEDQPGIKQLATTARESSQNVELGYTYFISNCELITRLEASGALPVSGNTLAKVWTDNIDSNFVNRRVEIQPENNAQISTGKVTLFYSQEDFDEYNKTHAQKLPVSPTDETNKQNVYVHYYAGTSSDNSATPASYKNAPVTTNIAAEKVEWNNVYQYWEVTIDATGFGGYMLSSSKVLSTAGVELTSVQVYPNPTSDYVTVTLPATKKAAKVALFDITGKTVLTTETTTTNPKVDLRKLPSGAYIMQISTSAGSVSKKILKD